MAGSGMHGLGEAMRTLAIRSTGSPATTNFTRSLTTTAPVTTLATHVPLTIHAFPTLEPTSLEQWSSKHLYVPLRRDILHRAVVFEADNTRQGTASTKTRWEVHGSHRKVRPQKGSGRARAGTRQSPIFRGGGVVFGPHPRDFGTSLTRKVYDQAWRMALSYRYRRGELIVCEDSMELPLPEDFTALRSAGYLEKQLVEGYMEKQAVQLLEAHQWDRKHGRTLFVTETERENLFEAVDNAGQHGRALEYEDVDVKDLLEDGRVVIERSALRRMVTEHSSDLESKIFINSVRVSGPPLGEPILT